MNCRPSIIHARGPFERLFITMPQPHSKMLVERRFPVRLGQQVGSLEDAYRREKSANWNPVSDIPWDRLRVDRLTQRDKDAARLMWSRRLWAAYGYLSETPATLIRLCLELDRPISPKFFLTVRNTQEACHIAVMQRMAEAYGGYISKPASAAYAATLNLDLSQRILHADTSIDAYVLAHCAIKIGVEAMFYELHQNSVKNEAIATTLGLIAKDKRRHAAFGWDFVTDRVNSWDDVDREAAKDEIVRAVDAVILSGYLTPFLAPSGVADEERIAEEHAAFAGLGCADGVQQTQALASFLTATQKKLQDLSIDIPNYSIV